MNLYVIYTTVPIISGVCLGVYIITAPDKIGYLFVQPFDAIRNYLDKEEKQKTLDCVEFTLMPLYLCVPCMASLWGTGIFYLMHGDLLCLEYPIVILSAVTLNKFLAKKVL